MLRVIFTLIGITFLFPGSIFGLLVCMPLTFCCIALQWVKPWQFLLAGSIIGFVYSIKLTALRVEFLSLGGAAIFFSTLTFVFWVLAFWKNPEFTYAVNEAQQIIPKP